jgi:hypothetical protein
LDTRILHPFCGTQEHKSDLRVAPARTSRAQMRQRGGYTMWTSLFAVTAVIAIALSMAAIVVDSADGGKFRL